MTIMIRSSLISHFGWDEPRESIAHSYFFSIQLFQVIVKTLGHFDPDFSYSSVLKSDTFTRRPFESRFSHLIDLFYILKVTSFSLNKIYVYYEFVKLYILSPSIYVIYILNYYSFFGLF